MIRNQLDLFVFYISVVYIAIESNLFYGFCRIQRKLTQKWRVSSVQWLKLTLIKCKLVSTWNSSLNLLIIAVVHTHIHTYRRTRKTIQRSCDLPTEKKVVIKKSLKLKWNREIRGIKSDWNAIILVLKCEEVAATKTFLCVFHSIPNKSAQK